MKKDWNNPELKNLGVENTENEDYCPNAPSRCFCNYYCKTCKGCKYTEGTCFWDKINIFKNKCICPGNMLPGEGEGGAIPTFS